MLARQRVRPRQGSGLSINSSVAAAHDAQSPYSGPPFSPLSGKTPRDHDDWSTVDADDLFVRFTVAETKNIQSKLRRDADAKQEELRLMVGERYRDLLHASTSIMSISESSQRVSVLLQDIKDACVSEEPVSKPIHQPRPTQDDGQLATLQSLSAHIKLLLDAPEHLWRFLEQRKFLHAAWLFLLSRVVHRALANSGQDGEDNDWETKGIDVLEQFPIVQRQWDSISHFKSNISHKATHSLREHNTVASDACSTLITLHLLESLPLNDTLNHLLTQRSKTLNILLTRSADRAEGLGFKTVPDSFASDPQSPVKQYDAVSEVSDVLASVLDVLASTVGVARAIFQRPAGSQTSLIEERLQRIQATDSNSPQDVPEDGSLVNTPSILAALPSSTHLLTLPSSVQSYRPFVDVEAASSRIAALNLETKLKEWLAKGVDGLQKRIQGWFSVLPTVAEIWAVRSRVIAHAENGMFGPQDRAQLMALLDGACKQRAQEVWEKQFATLQQTLQDGLQSALKAIRSRDDTASSDIAPATYLYAAHPPPSLSLVGANPLLALNTIQEYKTSLRRRLSGRTPLLHNVLHGCEKLAAAEREDLSVLVIEEGTDPLAHELRELYAPAGDAACRQAIDVLTSGLDSAGSDCLDGVLLVSRICHELATASPFAEDLKLSTQTEIWFREQLAVLNARALGLWQTAAAQAAIDTYHLPHESYAAAVSSDFALPSQPSSSLVQALIGIVTSTQRLGLSKTHLAERQPAHAALNEFSEKFSTKTAASPSWSPTQAQLLWDVEFLQHLNEAGVVGEDTAAGSLVDLRRQLVASIPKSSRGRWADHMQSSLQQQLGRLQILLAPLLSLAAWDAMAPAGTARAPLLRVGAPTATSDARADASQSHVPRFILLAS